MSSKELYIGNIEPKTKPEELKELFQIYGTVNRSEVIIGSITHNAAYGFIEFESTADAQRAHQKEHGRTFRTRRLIVQFARTKKREAPLRSQSKGFRDNSTKDNNSERDRRRSRSRSYKRDDSRDRYRRRHRRSSSLNEKSIRDRNRARSRSPSSNYKSNSRRFHTSSSRTSHSYNRR